LQFSAYRTILAKCQRRRILRREVVRVIASETYPILGSFLYTTLATAASVAFGLNIDDKCVENWCASVDPRESQTAPRKRKIPKTATI
jgi:hypothetical protein